ncbi:MAG TPA: hypothetical protein VN043_15940 [Rhodanobacter sp.]|nr:hypothetical protein [Rhodanobacter sp.]
MDASLWDAVRAKKVASLSVRDFQIRSPAKPRAWLKARRGHGEGMELFPDARARTNHEVIDPCAPSAQ